MATNKAKADETEKPKTKRLRELDPPGGAGLGRVKDFDADHADGILQLCAGMQYPTWELVDESVPVTE